ncbi:MAG: hypothetical protein R2822_08885 [Spirosomataceae bacterium]
MEVPTKQEFEELQREVAALNGLVKQMSAVRVNVEWVSLDVAAIVLNCSQRTVSRLIKDNQLSILKTNRKVRVGLASIRSYLAKNKYEPAIVEARINSLYGA